MKKRNLILSLAASGMLAFGVAACGDDEETGGGGGDVATDLSGDLAGAGASSQEAAMEAWIAGIQGGSPELNVSYDPVGSGGGREQFIDGGIAFGGTDSPLEGDELQGAIDRCAPGDLVQVPTYVSPIAIIYNLEGVDSLQLSPETLAGIFAQEITTWNDDAIAEDNPDAELPDTAIAPVNRSDESGTTENFADYMSKTAPDVWTFPVDGNWPVNGGESAQGTSGVVEAVGAGDGTIGYADASQAGDLGIATIQVGESFEEPSPEAAASILDESEDTASEETIFAYELNRETESEGTYPIVLVSYEMACTEYEDANEGELVKGLLSYIVSPDGQTAAADNAGSAPLSESVTEQVQPVVDSIQGGSE